MTSDIQTGGWLEDKTDDPEFQRLYAREDFIEEFLHRVEEEMASQRVSRTELARRLECRPGNITRIFHKTSNLTAATMVDVAFCLNLRLQVHVRKREDAFFFSKPSAHVIPWPRPHQTQAWASRTVAAPAEAANGARLAL